MENTEDLIIEAGILTKGGVMEVREIIKEQGRWDGHKEGKKEIEAPFKTF